MSRLNQHTTTEPFKIATSMKIGHVSLNVSNLDRSLDFYQKILGFKVAAKSGEKAILSAPDNSQSNLIELLQIKTNPDRSMFRLPTSEKRAGLYHFAILLPERKYLADMLLNLVDNQEQVHFDGFADHLVSESIYIRDPDLNGIEIYRDRQRSEWNWNGNQIEMATLPLNNDDLLREASGKAWKEMPPKTTIGHIHLHVGNLSKAMKFYNEILGMELTATVPSAAFFAAGKYHHHIAANTWLGTGILPADHESIGLNHYSIVLPRAEDFERLRNQMAKYNPEVAFSEESHSILDPEGIKVKLELTESVH